MTQTQNLEQTTQTLVFGVFEPVQRGMEAIDRLVDAGFDVSRVGGLMSDRTAERHFSLFDVHEHAGSFAPLGANVSRFSQTLKPIAALGEPGSGLVGTGPLVAVLTGAGLGTRGGIEDALEALGVAPETASEIRTGLLGGSMIVGVVAERERVGAAEAALRGGARLLRAWLTHPVPEAGTLIETPEAPAGEQRARYEPRLDWGQDATGQKTASTKFRS